MDDFLVFGNDKERLAEYMAAARVRLDGLRLLLNERKSHIYPVTQGIPFLGFRTFPHQRRLRPASVKRTRQRFVRLAADFGAGRIKMDRVKAAINAWQAHAAHGDSLGLRRRLLADAVFTKGADGRRSARGLVEQ